MNGGAKVFISDLHLGDGSRADDFHRKGEFLKFLDTLRSKENSKLIIAGDLFELWQTDLDKIIFCHNEIIKQLLMLAKDDRLIYLIGNHDHLPFVKFLKAGLNIRLEFEDKDLGLWSEHGNQYDLFNRYKDPGMAIRNKLGRSTAYIMGWLERILHPDIDEWTADWFAGKGGQFLKELAGLKNKITPSSEEYYKKGGNLSEYEEAACRLIEKGKRIVIFGHTHYPILKRLGNGIYANCGCWCGKQAPAYIELTDKKIELIDGISHSIMNSLEL